MLEVIPDCQRWRERRDTYRPAGEPIDTRRYGVEVVHQREAKPFVLQHHYAGSYPAARLAVGLWRNQRWLRPELAGVAVFSVGVQPAAVRRWCGTPDGIELGRFVLLDDVPANGETWFLLRLIGMEGAGSALKVARVQAWSEIIRGPLLPLLREAWRTRARVTAAHARRDGEE